MKEKVGRARRLILIIIIAIVAIVLIVGLVIVFGREKKQDVAVGDKISIGKYEQDGNDDNGKEGIQWVVLDKQDGHLLVMSENALEAIPYNDGDGMGTTWDKSSLRIWLNDKFLNDTFTSEERERIILSDVKSEDNIEYSTRDGSDTQDYIFLLSINEALTYISDDSNGKCKASDYVASLNEATLSEDDETCIWWLRSPGDLGLRAATIETDGSLNTVGYVEHFTNICVRPVMWID